MKRHLILIGLPGAGKTTVARAVAAALDTHVTDIDPVLERATGLRVSELFQVEGERAFRARERVAVLEALQLPAHVIAPGGGWAAEPGNLESVGGRALVIHLAVSPETAAVRLHGTNDRPLLAGADPAPRLAELARVRAPWYARAEARVDAGRGLDEIRDEVVGLARRLGGW